MSKTLEEHFEEELEHSQKQDEAVPAKYREEVKPAKPPKLNEDGSYADSDQKETGKDAG